MPPSPYLVRPVRPAPVRVLIVEDEGLVALDLEERLAKLGYEVAGIADNGVEALRLAGAEKVDLVLMDIHIRGKMDGVQTAQAVRQTTEIPVVFLTAHADEATLQRAGLTEPFGYVLKPFDERELHATLQMALYRHRAESRLRKMERWLATTLRSIGDGVIATDGEGRITFMNAMAEAMSGRTRSDALGYHLSKIIGIITKEGRDETAELLAQAMTHGTTITLGEGHRLRTTTGRLVPVDDSLAPIRDEQGNVTGCVVIFRDHAAHLEAAAQRRQLEAKIQEAQRLESLSMMAGGIAHEFNNALMAVIWNASVGLTMTPNDSPLASCLKGIETAADSAALLCRQMIAYVGKGQMTLENFELSAIVRGIEQPLQLAMHKGVTLSFDLAEGLPRFCADGSQIQQILTNLVINGSEALGGLAGQVRVRTCKFTATRAFLSECRIGAELSEGDYLLLEVSDTGSGMAPEVLTRIFDPFFTTKFAGRGLGLAAVSGIVRSHGGALAVTSTPGAGTTFQLLFAEEKVEG